MASAWVTLGGTSPRELTGARLLLHHAVQLVAAVGRCLLPPQADDGNTSLEWVPASGLLAGPEVGGHRPWRLALRPGDLSLHVVCGDTVAASRSLAGQTVPEAFAWIVDRATDRSARSGRLRLDRSYPVPDHPVAHGAAFSLPGDASLEELGRWYAGADGLLRQVTSGWPESAPVRVWPHHFDIGSVLPLGGSSGDPAASIGIGLSPGDEGIPEPYLYVTPWPPPAPGALPGLPSGGHWHEKGWTGVVLTGSEVVAAASSARATQVRAFLVDTVDALRAAHDPHR